MDLEKWNLEMTAKTNSVSIKQEKANQRNAKKSTGPKTTAGKLVSKLNSTKHGITSKEAVLPWEDEKRFEELRNEVIDHYAPKDVIQTVLVNIIVRDIWRLLRIRRAEIGAFSIAHHEAAVRRAEEAVAEEKDILNVLDNILLSRQKSRKLDSRKKNLAKEKARLRSYNGSDAELFMEQPRFLNGLAILMRYDATTTRSLFMTMEKLEKLQRTRIDDSKLVSIVDSTN